MSYTRKRFKSLLFLSLIIISSLLISDQSKAVGAEFGDVQVWWPTQGVSVSGHQPFKGMMNNRSVNDYQMFWSVDDGQLNYMASNYADYPHKESAVDLTSWNWRGNGPYVLTFVAKDNNGNVIGRRNVTINIPNQAAPVKAVEASQTLPAQNQTSPIQTPLVVQTQLAQSNTVPSTPVAGNPLSGKTLYKSSWSNASTQANAWRASRPNDAALMDKVAGSPTAQWIGEWSGNPRDAVNQTVTTATAQGQVPVFVAYNIPQRDCGGWSAGGNSSPEGYRAWIRSFAEGIAGRKAVVILEPDSVSLTTCLSPADKETRYQLLSDAVNTLKAQGQTVVYIDAGHPNWIDASEMASRLTSAGVARADGFALNVSNFYSTNENISYGEAISRQIGGKHFVIDTSRNGLGAPADSEWCNPSGRALGERASVNTGRSLVDAYLWVKAPGESDGLGNGGPAAGVWWPEYALGLASRASW